MQESIVEKILWKAHEKGIWKEVIELAVQYANFQNIDRDKAYLKAYKKVTGKQFQE